MVILFTNSDLYLPPLASETTARRLWRRFIIAGFAEPISSLSFEKNFEGNVSVKHSRVFEINVHNSDLPFWPKPLKKYKYSRPIFGVR
ncbi:hypothetical protein NBO_26g0019 [Nosema bombycis CQ1]|uniref:Uncharacterized protein n=1 Tax=Nosema bombycis (strain CQ1 / CVCC 102059) TaxID=578461 RepID=R0M989_NOSB1|nr:hypothetical protein NBO_26g0019 [Nosema bombycis CQ1]|eukprot:EOB14534.1 hypothetical protein NBO_26g0019 [Nosema bombycis CQ1]